MKKNSLIYVAAHEELLGFSIAEKLKEKGYKNVILKTAKELDLTDQGEVGSFFRKNKPEYVFLPSVKSGGISANSAYPADFIYQNIACQTNVIDSSFRYGVKKLLFLGSACSYPKICLQPIKEEYLLTGTIEPTNESYAIAKIAGIKMCQAYSKQHKKNFIAAIPTNVYGPGDDFGPGGHVVAGLIKRFDEALKNNNEDSEIKIWGTGKPKREFIYSEDFAEACLFLMNNYDAPELINIAGGKEVSIKILAELVKKITGFKGKIIYENEKPDGIPRRLLDSKKISGLGWRPKIKMEKGLKLTHKWYKIFYRNYKNN
jgi:GDP-L-fucose synthase